MLIKIVLANNSIIYVQKKKLVEKSVVFDIMLSQHMLEAENKLIDMSAYNPVAVINLLIYILYDKYPTIDEFANEYEYGTYLETFALAHQYSMLPLANHITKSIAYGINNVRTFDMLFGSKYMNMACSKVLLLDIRDIFIKRLNDMVIFNPLCMYYKDNEPKIIYVSLEYWFNKNSRICFPSLIGYPCYGMDYLSGLRLADTEEPFEMDTINCRDIARLCGNDLFQCRDLL